MKTEKIKKQDIIAKKLSIILILHIVALLLSLYLVKDHFDDEEGTICDLGAHISCTKIRRSNYSEVLNVPVAVLGVIYNILIIFLTIKIMFFDDSDRNHYTSALYYLQLIGLAFVFYLIFAEVMVGALCPYCTIIHLIQFVTFYFTKKIFSTLKTVPTVPSIMKELKIWMIIFSIIGVSSLVMFNFHYMLLPEESPVVTNDNFAKCISENGWKMIGSGSCGWCQRQKKLFGDTFKYINFIDCDAVDCTDYNLEGYPTWVKIIDEVEKARSSGFISIESLKIITDCDH
eukprot:TRINITY_DN831_c0_g1_i1.p1 TRINITY_DN831_c0_g1~~TRINITY_DN831_c0_g1_i1.p1  ORF type:complete len:287 (-),score=57.00 TRINITY_DN831_c0_g1_i1:106-966(-)